MLDTPSAGGMMASESNECLSAIIEARSAGATRLPSSDRSIRLVQREASMKVLIIGGTGLISTAITRFLVERGDEVTHYNRGKLDLYPTPAGVRTIQGDRTDYPRFEQQMAEAGHFDCVMDMVGYAPEDAASAARRAATRHERQGVGAASVAAAARAQPASTRLSPKPSARSTSGPRRTAERS